jgi:hypothetical protein
MAAMVSTAMVGVLISGAPSMLALEAQFSLAQLISSACF